MKVCNIFSQQPPSCMGWPTQLSGQNRTVWCFTGEDYMHHVQVLAQSCIAGTGPFLTVNKTIDKMRFALHVQFSKHQTK